MLSALSFYTYIILLFFLFVKSFLWNVCEIFRDFCVGLTKKFSQKFHQIFTQFSQKPKCCGRSRELWDTRSVCRMWNFGEKNFTQFSQREKRGVLIVYAPRNNTHPSTTYLNIFRIGGGYFGKNKNKERKLIWAPQFSLQKLFKF